MIRGQVPAAHLARDYERLRDPALRARIGEADLRAIEDRYRHYTPAIDYGFLVLPLSAGEVVSGMLVLQHADKAGAAAGAGGMMLVGIGAATAIMAFVPRNFALYKSQLADAHIELTLVPTGSGAALVGRF